MDGYVLYVCSISIGIFQFQKTRVVVRVWSGPWAAHVLYAYGVRSSRIHQISHETSPGQPARTYRCSMAAPAALAVPCRRALKKRAPARRALLLVVAEEWSVRGHDHTSDASRMGGGASSRVVVPFVRSTSPPKGRSMSSVESTGNISHQCHASLSSQLAVLLRRVCGWSTSVVTFDC